MKLCLLCGQHPTTATGELPGPGGQDGGGDLGRHTNCRPLTSSCGNVAAILELDEHLQKDFIIFEAAPQETRGIPSKKPVADYFL